MRKAVKTMVGMPILPTFATSVAAALQSIIKRMYLWSKASGEALNDIGLPMLADHRIWLVFLEGNMAI